MQAMIAFLNTTAGRIAVAIAVLTLLFAALMIYGANRFNAGKRASDAEWRAASDALEKKAATSADEATRRESVHIAEHSAMVEQEKERIDEAISQGLSPFDVLFSDNGVQPN